MKALAMMILMMVLMILASCVDDRTPTSVVESEAKRKRDAGVDAPPPPDAPAQGTPGWVSCFTSGNPEAACNLSTSPGYCCFDNFVAPNNGSCIETSCSQSTLACDQDADCLSGEKCWAAQYRHADDSLFIAGACATAPPTEVQAGPWHLCRPDDGTCEAGQTCVQAEAAPANLYAFSPKIYVCHPF